MDQALFDKIQELQHASYFRTENDGFSRIVDSPYLGGPIASAFERITRLADPIVELGRLGVHEIHDCCVGLDPTRDSLECLDQTMLWTREGAITVRRMAGGRC